MLLREFDDGWIIESKIQEINNWERNSVFDEVENKGQKTINTWWAITEKVKEERMVCKTRLVVTGFEEFGKNMETLKLCIAKTVQKG